MSVENKTSSSDEVLEVVEEKKFYSTKRTKFVDISVDIKAIACKRKVKLLNLLSLCICSLPMTAKK